VSASSLDYVRSTATAGGASPHWHYDRIPDLGENPDLEFADRHNTGEYRLEVVPEKREAIFTLWPCGKMINEALP